MLTTPLTTADQHQQTQELLAWYVNRTLTPVESKQVEQHLQTCVLCKRDLAHLRNLSATVMQTSDDIDLVAAAENSFAGLRNKLPSQKTSSPNHDVLPLPAIKKAADSQTQRLKHYFTDNSKHFAMAALLMLAVIPLSVYYFQSPTPTDYYTLSASLPEPPAASQLHVVFAKPLTDSQMQSLLTQIHAKQLTAPNTAGAYTFTMDDKALTDMGSIISLLRERPDVLLAEPVLHP